LNNLRAARKAKGLTQAEVAKAIGLTQNGYSYWENGKSKIDREQLLKLATLFDVSTDYLLGKETPTPVAGDELDRNIIRIIGRDGSFYEGKVSDSQRELFKQMLDNLKPVDDENI